MYSMQVRVAELRRRNFSSDGRNHSVRTYFPDRIIKPVTNVDISFAINCNTRRRPESSVFGGTINCVLLRTASESSDDTLKYLADPPIAEIGDVHGARCIKCDTARCRELCL